MTGSVLLDTNLLVLLVVGSASRGYIARHKRLQEFTEYDFDLLGLLIAQFSDLVLLPHVLAEASNLIRQISGSARADVQRAFGTLIETATELPIESVLGARRSEFAKLGLTDSIILYLCSMAIDQVNPTLITADSDLADAASSVGYSVIDYRRDFLEA
jgi:hypothetical protein